MLPKLTPTLVQKPRVRSLRLALLCFGFGKRRVAEAATFRAAATAVLVVIMVCRFVVGVPVVGRRAGVAQRLVAPIRASKRARLAPLLG